MSGEIEAGRGEIEDRRRGGDLCGDGQTVSKTNFGYFTFIEPEFDRVIVLTPLKHFIKAVQICQLDGCAIVC